MLRAPPGVRATGTMRSGVPRGRGAGVASLVCVHSFRGGTGKSNVTANLAATAGRRGERVAIVDSDVQSPGIHALFGMDPEDAGASLNDFLQGRCRIEETARDVTPRLRGEGLAVAGGGACFLVPASMRPGEIAQILRSGYDVALLEQGYRQLTAALSLDRIFVDTHPGLNEETLLSMAVCDCLVIVLRPDRQDFQGTAVVADLARNLEVPRAVLVLNKVPDALDGAALSRQCAQTYGLPVVAVLPLSPDVACLASEDLFSLVRPDHPFSAGIRALAAAVLGPAPGTPGPAESAAAVPPPTPLPLPPPPPAPAPVSAGATVSAPSDAIPVLVAAGTAEFGRALRLLAAEVPALPLRVAWEPGSARELLEGYAAWDPAPIVLDAALPGAGAAAEALLRAAVTEFVWVGPHPPPAVEARRPAGAVSGPELTALGRALAAAAGRPWSARAEAEAAAAEARRRAAPLRQLWAVHAPKGNSGCTRLVAGLAAALAEGGWRVLAVDGTAYGDLGRLLGGRGGGSGLAGLLRGEGLEAAGPAPCAGGFPLLGAGPDAEAASAIASATAAEAERALAALDRADYDVVLVDSDHAPTPWVQACLRRAGRVLLPLPPLPEARSLGLAWLERGRAAAPPSARWIPVALGTPLGPGGQALGGEDGPARAAALRALAAELLAGGGPAAGPGPGTGGADAHGGPIPGERAGAAAPEPVRRA